MTKQTKISRTSEMFTFNSVLLADKNSFSVKLFTKSLKKSMIKVNDIYRLPLLSLYLVQ